MKYQYDYDVKDELMALLTEKANFSGVNVLSHYMEVYRNEKNPSTRNLIKFCIYKLSAHLSDRESKNFDCDVSRGVIESFPQTYSWLKNSVIEHQTDRNGNIIPMKYQLRTSDTVFRGDTMTSIWTTLKEYVKLKTGTHMIDEADSWELFILRNHKRIDLSYHAGRFIQLGHSIGNFMPVPPGFNVGRSNYGKWDYWDLTLCQIHQWYMDNPINSEYVNNRALDILFDNERNKQTSILNCQMWLKSFETWEQFIQQNYMESFVDKNGVPKRFFKSHSLNNPLPTTIKEFEEFFKTVNECIMIRGKRIIAVMQAQGYAEQQSQNNFKDKIDKINPSGRISTQISVFKQELRTNPLETTSCLLCYLSKIFFIFLAVVYYIHFLMIIGFEQTGELYLQNIEYMPFRRYTDSEFWLIAIIIFSVLLLCISYTRKNRGLKRIGMFLVLLMILILCILPVIYMAVTNAIQNTEWFQTWLYSDYMGNTGAIKLYIRIYGIICLLFTIIPIVWLFIDSYFRTYIKYCLKKIVLPLIAVPYILMMAEDKNGLIVMIFAVGIILIIGWKKRCSTCGKLFALKQVGEQVLGSKEISVKVDVEQKGTDGKTYTTTQYVPGVLEYYDVIYKCKYCGCESRKHLERKVAKI